MNINKIFLLFGLLFLLLGCKHEKDIQPSIIGKWQSVYQKGYSGVGFFRVSLDKKYTGITYKFDNLGKFAEFQTFLAYGKDTTVIRNEFPFKIIKDSLIFTKPVDYIRKHITYSYYHKYKIEGDTLTLMENIELSNKNTTNKLIAMTSPQLLTPDLIKNFGHAYEDYYLEMKFKRIQ